MLKVFEAFAGYGSQSIALRNLGIDYEVVAISEIDKYAIKAYEAIHGEVNNLGDISKLNVKDIPRHDLFTYSFPCQDISVAGKQKGVIRGETRSGLLYECERLIEHCKPKYLLMENVKNLVGKKHKPQFDEWLQYLETLGYTNYWQVLNAKDYGVPQNRERVFVVSILGEHKPYEFPKPIKLEKRLKDMLESVVDDKYYLSDKIQKRFKPTKPNNSENNAIDATDYKQLKQVLECVDRLGGCFDTETSKHQAGSVWNKEALCPTLDTMQGGYRQPLITEDIKIEKIGNLECKGWHEIETRVHSTEGLAPTVETRNRAKYLDKIRIRKLTPKECFRLMGLSNQDIDKIQATKISDTQQYKLAGNSIVVDVLEGIFRELFLSNNNQYNTEKVILGKEEVEQLSFVI